MTPAEVLEKAAAIVEVRWCQGTYGVLGGRRCALGAIAEVLEIFPTTSSATEPAAELYFAIGTGKSVSRWNDDRRRTARSVARKMRHVAAKLARKGGGQ